jgi:periplasmic protein TonB
MIRLCTQSILAISFTIVLFILMLNLIHYQSETPKNLSITALSLVDYQPEVIPAESRSTTLSEPQPNEMIELPSVPISIPTLAGSPISIPLQPPIDLSIAEFTWQQPNLNQYQVEVSQPSTEIIPIVTIPPVYPRTARRARIEGWTKLRFTITENGSVKNIKIISSEPTDIFDQAAIESLQQWRFQPRIELGKPVSQTATQLIRFNLSS